MALTITPIYKGSIGNKYLAVAEVTFDNSYPTNGEAVAAADLGLNAIEAMTVHGPIGASRIVTWDDANSKLKVYTALSTEAANASDQSTIKVKVWALGY